MAQIALADKAQDTQEVAFCYHCRLYHPKTDMRQMATRSGKRASRTTRTSAKCACAPTKVRPPSA